MLIESKSELAEGKHPIPIGGQCGPFHLISLLLSLRTAVDFLGRDCIWKPWCVSASAWGWPRTLLFLPSGMIPRHPFSQVEKQHCAFKLEVRPFSKAVCDWA